MKPLVRPWRLGKEWKFWGVAVYLNPDNNPIFAVARTPKDFVIMFGRWQWMKGGRNARR